MMLLFKGGGQAVCLDIDRVNEKLEVCSSKTDYKFEKQPFTALFDPGKEKEQYELTKDLPDDQFELVLEAAFQKAGYSRQPLPK